MHADADAYPFFRTEQEQALLKLADDVLTEIIADGSYPELCKKWLAPRNGSPSQRAVVKNTRGKAAVAM